MLAKKAALSTSSLVVENVPLCSLEARRIVSKVLWSKWEKEWIECKVGATTKEFFPSPFDAKCLQNVPLYHEITQVISGHSILNAHLAKTNLLPFIKDE